MKATPIRGNEPRAYCDNCGSWHTFNLVETYRVNQDYRVHVSEYRSGMEYFTTAEQRSLHKCDNCDEIIVNEDDSDELDISTYSRDLWWKCESCGVVYEAKEDADACCV